MVPQKTGRSQQNCAETSFSRHEESHRVPNIFMQALISSDLPDHLGGRNPETLTSGEEIYEVVSPAKPQIFRGSRRCPQRRMSLLPRSPVSETWKRQNANFPPRSQVLLGMPLSAAISLPFHSSGPCPFASPLTLPLLLRAQNNGIREEQTPGPGYFSEVNSS